MAELFKTASLRWSFRWSDVLKYVYIYTYFKHKYTSMSTSESTITPPLHLPFLMNQLIQKAEHNWNADSRVMQKKGQRVQFLCPCSFNTSMMITHTADTDIFEITLILECLNMYDSRLMNWVKMKISD